MDKPIAKLKLLTTKGEVVDAILYCHQETTTIAGTTYYLLKLNTPADASGTTLSASTASVARVVWGRFVFPLAGIAKILSGTIYATYRAYTGGGTVNAEIDILIRKADGTVRTTIATGVSKSANLGTSWATYTGASYSFAEYTVVDQTDYLEIDYIANVTAKKSGQYAYLRIDDQTLNQADQTRSQEWSLTGITTLSATNVTFNGATLNGQINGTETMTIRGFEWGTQSGNYTDSWTESGTFSPGTFRYDLTNLSPGTTYYFRAKAYSDATGWIYGSERSFTTLTPTVTTYPASYITRTSATLKGSTNFTATIRGFEWGKQSGNYTDSWTESDSFPAGSYTHTITNLDPDTTYYFRAKAYNPSLGWVYGREQSFTTPLGEVLWLTPIELGSNSELIYKLDLQPTTQTGASGDFFTASPTLIGIRVWKRSADGTETEITGGTPVAQADLTNLQDQTLNVRTGTWTITSPIPLDPTDRLVVRVYIFSTAWTQLWEPMGGYRLVWVSDPLNATQINPSTITVYYYVFLSTPDDNEYFLYGNDYSRLTNVILSLPIAITETIVAKNFPMNYLPSPAKAAQLTSKVSGATITTVSQDYPLTLLKKDKAQELKSKWT